MLNLTNDLEVAPLLAAEIAAEAARIEHHQRDLARHRGVTWSAMGPTPFESRSPASLHAAAEAQLAARRLWSTSSKGKLLSAIAACQAAAQRAHAVGERARAGAARDEPLEWCKLVLRDLSTEAQALMTNLAEAQRAVSDN